MQEFYIFQFVEHDNTSTKKNYRVSKSDKFIFKSLKELQNSPEKLSKVIDTNGLESWINRITSKYGGASDAIKEFAKSHDMSTASMKDFRKWCDSANGSASKFGTTVKDIGITAGTSAISAGVSMAIEAVVTLIKNAWDKANVTLAETKAQTAEIESNLKALQSQYNILSSLSPSSRTAGDNAKLESLKEQIRLQEQLLEYSKGEEYKEFVGKKFTDYFDEDSMAHKVRELEKNHSRSGKVEGSNVPYHGIGEVTAADAIQPLYEEANQTYKKTSEELAGLEKKYGKDSTEYKLKAEDVKKDKDKLDTYKTGLMDLYKYSDVRQKKADLYAAQIQDAMNSGYLDPKGMKNAEEWLERVQAISEDAASEKEKIDNILYSKQAGIDNILSATSTLNEEELKKNFTDEELQLFARVSFKDKDVTLDELQEMLRLGIDETGQIMEGKSLGKLLAPNVDEVSKIQQLNDKTRKQRDPRISLSYRSHATVNHTTNQRRSLWQTNLPKKNSLTQLPKTVPQKRNISHQNAPHRTSQLTSG